jgi:hypothetical protein
MDYRPTVRYSDDMKAYVDDLFYATHLDRNQLFRAALFFFGSDSLSKNFLETHVKKQMQLPSPLTVQQPNHDFFMKFANFLDLSVGGRDVFEPSEGGTSEKIIVKSKGIKLIVRDEG